jgi:phosphoglycolate phosphatase
MHLERGTGRCVSYDEARAWSSVGGHKMIAALLGDFCGDLVAEIADFRRRYATRPTPMDSLFADVEAGLRHLRGQDLRLAICSNKPQELCEKVLSDCGLADLFDCVVGGAPDRKAKPNPELLDRALAGLGVTPDTCIYVGDSEIDHAIATTRAMRFLFVNYGYAASDWDEPGVERLDHFGQVVDAVIASRSALLAGARTDE